MSRIDDLINELCPHGVEFKQLWEVTAWDKRFNAVENFKQSKIIKYRYLLAKDLKNLEDENGEVKLLSTGNYEAYTTVEKAGGYLSDGEIIAIPWGGTAIVKYYKGKFVTADNRIATSIDTSILNNKFLYYCMINKKELLQSFYRGSGIQHPSMNNVLSMSIPVPPLEVQNEIVRILDNFSALEAELEAELEARNQQYEYYRNKLLDFSKGFVGVPKIDKLLAELCPEGVTFNFAKNLFEIKRGKRVVKKELNDNGNYPVYQNKLAPMGYYHEYNVEGNTTYLISAGAAGQIGFSVERFWAADDCIVFMNPKVMNNKFFYYFLHTQQDYIISNIRKASIPRLSRTVIENIVTPIPPIDIQNEIVRILDNFSAYLTSLTDGLPAEIKARSQQYEYYRNKLLTF